MLDVEASSDHPDLSVVLAEKGDVDGVTSTADVVLPVGHGEEVDPKHSTNRSSRARRQGVACSAALDGGREARGLCRLRCREPARRRAARVARSRVPRSPAPRPSRRGQRSDVDRDRVPALLVHVLRGDLDGRAARGGAGSALRPRRDREALTLWTIAQAPVAEVRRRVCAWPVSSEDVTRWPTLLRWARAARDALHDSSLSLRDAASRAAQIAIGHAPSSLRTAPQCHQAFAGGSAMR